MTARDVTDASLTASAAAASAPAGHTADPLAASVTVEHPAWAVIARDYVTLTKPAIILLLLITTVPAMYLAAAGWPGTWSVVATLIGGILAAGGAGAVNMYLDRDIDEIMLRTRSRPIPGGRIPARHAAIFGYGLGLASGPWLWLTVNEVAAALALGAFAFYVFVYSMYLKRHTVHNTVLGGVAGAAPPLIGWAAVTGSVTVEGLLLFFIVFYWQPPHFWVLAIALADDYRRARIPMMPVVLGERETKRQTMLYTVLTWAVSLIFGVAVQLSAIYFTVAILGGAGFLLAAVRVARSPGATEARQMFRYSTLYLAALFGAMVVDRIVFG
jgi:heme o synthase